jgi:DNA polymerase III epsilon subunit-like protein
VKSLIFDTETTGFPKTLDKPLDQQPHVIEFYGEVIDHDNDFEVVDFVDQIFHCGYPLPPKITEVTGLTDNDLVGKPWFPEMGERIWSLFQSVDFVVAHNIGFDSKMMRIELARSKIISDPLDKLPKMGKPRCTMLKGCTVMKQTRWPKLSALHSHLFDEEFEGAHRAIIDVKATTRCYIEMVKQGAWK